MAIELDTRAGGGESLLRRKIFVARAHYNAANWEMALRVCDDIRSECERRASRWPHLDLRLLRLEAEIFQAMGVNEHPTFRLVANDKLKLAKSTARALGISRTEAAIVSQLRFPVVA